MKEERILVVDDERIVRDSLEVLLREEGFGVDCVEGGREALEMVRSRDYAGVLLDLRMPGIDGIETLRELRRLVPSLPIVMMTAFAEVPTAVAAMKSGARDYVTKPFDPDEICQVVRQVVLQKDSTNHLTADLTPGNESWSYEDFSGCSAAMARAIELARKAATTEVAILLRGERGLGKECLGRAIHAASRRRFEAFVPVHCAGVAEGVLEIELFGHEKGVLPGTPVARKGRLEMADRGTLYLDEVISLPQRLQVALLSALEDRVLVRLGGEARCPIDLRLICSTSVNVENAIVGGSFLSTLHGLLSSVVIDIPPLRKRREDIPPLAHRLLRRRRLDLGKIVEEISPAAMEILNRYEWPGNVREMVNVLDRAIVTCSGNVIRPEDLVLP